MSLPSSLAAVNGKWGLRNDARAINIISAFPVSIISLACAAVVISPTAPVRIPASFLIVSANGTCYPEPSGIQKFEDNQPEEQ